MRLACLVRLPQREVARVVLGVCRRVRGRGEVLERLTGQRAVLGVRTHIKVDGAVKFVSISCLNERAYQVDDLRNVASGTRLRCRRLDPYRRVSGLELTLELQRPCPPSNPRIG